MQDKVSIDFLGKLDGKSFKGDRPGCELCVGIWSDDSRI